MTTWRTSGGGVEFDWTTGRSAHLMAAFVLVRIAVIGYLYHWNFSYLGEPAHGLILGGVCLTLLLSSTVLFRTANRVRLHDDGTLDLVRLIGTRSVPIGQVRAVVRRFGRIRKRPGYALRLRTDRGTFLVRWDLDTRYDMVETLRVRHPAIEVVTR